MIKILSNSGYCFLRELEPGKIELENKFTGTLIVYDEQTEKYEVII